MRNLPAGILVIDDDESMRAGIQQTLAGEGYRVETAADGASGLERFADRAFDLVLLDLRMPGLAGMDVLKRIKERSPHAAVIVITGYPTIEIAVEAMKGGALDFLKKPFTAETLCLAVNGLAERRQALLAGDCLDVALDEAWVDGHLLGRSDAMQRAIRQIRMAARTDSTVLVTGETGVGKELAARTLHRLSARKDRPFVTVDCGVLVESLFESELFGHVRGAFTGALETTVGKFELADGGTIFLDEIANIGVDLQARLLRVLQEREITKVGANRKVNVDVRVIAATNRNLRKAIDEGRFREDLYYRINVVPIALPPLRDRAGDVEILARSFLRRFAASMNRPFEDLAPAALEALNAYDWPGNVRELRNAIECACVNSDHGTLDLAALPPAIGSAGRDARPRDARDPGPVDTPGGSLLQAERNEIVRVLRRFDGNKTRAAAFLGINRKTLREKLQRFGLGDE